MGNTNNIGNIQNNKSTSNSPSRHNPNINNPLGKKLNKLGLKTGLDFAMHMPLRYEDETKIFSIKEAVKTSGIVQIVAKVVNQSWAGNAKKQLIIEVADETAHLNLHFINASY